MKIQFKRLAILAAAGAAGFLALQQTSLRESTTVASPAARVAQDALALAYERRQSNLWVQAAGEVRQVLQDDNTGSRHQRFILELPSGQTVLIAHNIDLAPRAPVAPGDSIEFRGEYEWNSQGGVVHWTHRDPQRRQAGGWIKKDDQLYQ